MVVTLDVLRGFQPFACFTDEELEKALPLCQEVSIAEGQLLFDEDDPAEYFYLILEGKIALETKVQLGRSGSRRPATISVLGSGQVTGWSSILAPHHYTSSGVCLEQASLIALPGHELREFIARYPASGLSFMESIAQVISSRHRNTTATMAYFLSVISHELKSPLAAVENYLQVMLGGYTGELTEKQQRMLGRSVLRINDLRALINNIVDLARMMPEQIETDFEQFAVGEVVAEAVEDIRLAVAEKEIRLRAVIPERLEPLVGARWRLRQVLSNLLSNAVKFSPPGSEITLRLRDEPDHLMIEVMDEGPGIPPEDQPHIFEDFYRGHDADQVAGSGLGLAIAKKIVDAHKGTISVESPYDPQKTGTKFTVIIPRGLSAPSGRRQTQSDQESSSNE
jgi:signal transduction histidine kinase